VPELSDESRGWANYFKLGPVGKAYRAIDAYTIDCLAGGCGVVTANFRLEWVSVRWSE